MLYRYMYIWRKKHSMILNKENCTKSNLIYPILIYTGLKINMNNRKYIFIYFENAEQLIYLSLKFFVFLKFFYMNSKWIIVQCLIDMIDKMSVCKSKFVQKCMCVKKRCIL